MFIVIVLVFYLYLMFHSSLFVKQYVVVSIFFSVYNFSYFCCLYSFPDGLLLDSTGFWTGVGCPGFGLDRSSSSKERPRKHPDHLRKVREYVQIRVCRVSGLSNRQICNTYTNIFMFIRKCSRQYFHR